MRSETQQTGRRRRGGRRHRNPRGPQSGANGTPRNGSSSHASSSPKAPAKKKGFFARLLAFFTGEPKKQEPGKVYGRVLDGPVERPERSSDRSDRFSDRPERTSERPPRAPRAERPAAEATSEARPPKPARKPELVEVNSPKLYVGNLSFDATESDLTELFAGAGQVQSSEVVSHRETQKSKGFAFVTMASVEEAKRAVAELHDKEFMGRQLVVSGAKTSDVR